MKVSGYFVNDELCGFYSASWSTVRNGKEYRIKLLESMFNKDVWFSVPNLSSNAMWNKVINTVASKIGEDYLPIVGLQYTEFADGDYGVFTSSGSYPKDWSDGVGNILTDSFKELMQRTLIYKLTTSLHYTSYKVDYMNYASRIK